MGEEKIESLLSRIDKKLGVLISYQIKAQESNTKLQVKNLHSKGLQYQDIAEILGISPSHAAKEISHLRKKNDKRKTTTD